MKKFLQFTQITALIALFCVPMACSQDTSESVAVVGDQPQITVGLPSTRTYLGDKAGDNYPTYWSAEDIIVVNGAVSTSSTINEDKTSATFYFENSILETPYHITYPYTEGSSCAEGKPTVVFKGEQHYVANTFGVGNAPMCGYFDGSNNIVLQHLAGVMRLSLKGSTTLAKIEITAKEGVALAGEFDVNCQSGTIVAIDEKTTNKVTYIAEEALSTSEAKDFYIVIPAGNLGACEVLITDQGGLTMKLQWNATDVKAGVVREFKAFSFKGGVSFDLGSLPAEEDELVIETPTSNKNQEIYYTNGSTTEPTVPNKTDVFGANIISNTYDAKKECWVIKFDGDVTSIGDGAFSGCSSLASVTIPDSVTSIGDYAFEDCTSLTSVTIPDSVTSIGYGAFSICRSLTSVTIPDSVISIEHSAFEGCTSLTDVTIGNGVTEIGINVFRACKSLKEFRGKYATDDGRCLIIDNTLIAYANASGTTFTIPDGVTTIGNNAFETCSNLTSVSIPESVTTINYQAFCCENLTSVYCKATTPPTAQLVKEDWNAFNGNALGRKIYVPISSLEAYKNAEYWSEYANDIEGFITTTLPESGEDAN